MQQQYVFFYHGTGYTGAKAVYDDWNIEPYTASGLGGPDTRLDFFTDFGKGFYTHTQENQALAEQWAKDSSCRSGDNGHWGVVEFAVPQVLFDSFLGNSGPRILVFQTKMDRPYNSPPYAECPCRIMDPGDSNINVPMYWLDFVYCNRGEVGGQDLGVMRPGDYNWSYRHDLIRGPIWMPDGREPFPDYIHQVNWLQAGLDQVINNPQVLRRLYDGYVECETDEGPVSESSGPGPVIPEGQN